MTILYKYCNVFYQDNDDDLWWFMVMGLFMMWIIVMFKVTAKIVIVMAIKLTMFGIPTRLA